MAKTKRTDIDINLVDGVTQTLTDIVSEFKDLSKVLTSEQLQGAPLQALQGRLRALRTELAQLDPGSARFGELAAEARALDGRIADLSAQFKSVSAAVAPATGSLSDLQQQLAKVRDQLARTDPKSAAFAKLAGDARGLQASITSLNTKAAGSASVFKTVGAAASGLSRQLANINQVSELVGKSLRLIGSGFGLGGALQDAGKLEDSLAAVQAVTHATTEEMQQLRAAAQAATNFSSAEAADGLAELARAGFSARQALETLNPVLALAQGQQLQVAEATQFVTTTLTQFQLKADSATRVADVLASGADKAQVTVRELGLSLSYAAPLANQLGLTLEQTVAIIAKLGDEGFRGERAGTALRNVFSALADPASKFSEALADAGVQSRNFATVITELAAKGDDGKRALLALDAEARPAILALVAKGGAGLKELEGALNDSAGAAQRTADILGNTFNSALNRLSNTLGTARDEFLQPLLPALTAELDDATLKITKFIASADFKTLANDFKTFVIDGVQGFKDFIGAADFKSFAANVNTFVGGSIKLLGGLAKTIGNVVDVVEVLGAGVKAPFNLLDAAWEGSKAIAASAGKVIVDTTQAVVGETVDLSAASQALGETASASYDKAGAAATAFGGNIKTFVVGPTDEATEATSKLKDQQTLLSDALKGVADSAALYRDALQRAGLILAESVGLSTERVEKLKGALSGISEEAKFAALNARAEFLVIANAADSTGEQITEAFRNAVRSANTKAELDELQLQFNKLGLAGKLTWEELAAGSEALGFKLRDLAQAAIPELEKQFKALGIVSQNELDKAAAAAAIAFDEIVEGARNGTAATADVERAFEAFARKQLAAADGADEFKRRQVEAMLITKAETLGVTAALDELGLVGEKATDKLATGADKATEALGGTREVVKETAAAAEKLDVSSASASGGITQVAAAAANASGSLGGMSQSLIDASNQLVAYGVGAEQQVTLFNEQAAAANRYRESLMAQIRELDPFEQAIEKLERRFSGLDRASLEAIARLEQRAQGLRDQIKKTQETIQATSSVGGGNPNGPGGGNPNGPGGGNPNGPGASNPQGGGGAQDNRQYSPTVNVNVSVPPGSQLSPDAVESIVRQILPTLRRTLANSL